MKKFTLILVILFVSLCGFAQGKYSIDRYLNIRSASAPSLSPDGKKIAFLTNITGTSQVWMIDADGGYPEQLTAYADNVGFARWSPDGSGLVFGKARGGDENTQFFWMSSDGADVRELTNDPKVRHNFGGWSKDGKRIYYSSNKRNRNFFDVYRMEVATGKEEILYQQDGSNSFAAASDDDTKVIISRSGTELSLDNDLYLLDTKSKTETLLTGHTGSAESGSVTFLPDGKSILLGSNVGREFYNLAMMNVSGSVAGRPALEMQFQSNESWDLDSTEVSRDGRLLALAVNREGYSELYLRSLETGGNPLLTFVGAKPDKIPLPARGIVGGLEFSRDAGKLLFTFNSARHNTDIWSYDLKTKSLKQITKSSRSGIPQSTFVEPELIKYKSFDGREIPAWYYRPVKIVEKIASPAGNFSIGIRPTRNLPVIVSVHGGPEGQERPGFSGLYQYYLSRGYAILATNVRGSTGYGKAFSHLDDVKLREDSVKDLAYSVEWLKVKGGADPKKIAVMGGSYGGYMTMAAVTLYPDLWAAAVNTVGIVNWETFLKNTSGYRRRQREVEYGRLDRDLEFLRSTSPIAKIDRIKAPLFVIHGKNDPRVPYTEAEQVVKALRDRGAAVEYKLYDDEGHGISKLKNRLDLYPLVADFLDRHMK
jgi:dipeptidyl aminopeptidase/acylaminoacyl peptidase